MISLLLAATHFDLEQAYVHINSLIRLFLLQQPPTYSR